MQDLLKKYSHASILLYYFIILAWFGYLEKIILVPKYYMFCFIDSYIPFVSIFVIPYIVWYLYITIPLIYLGFKSKNDFLKFCTLMFSAMTVCLIVYMIFPNGQTLRPTILGNSIWDHIVAMLYRSDTPTNSAPSMHVTNAMAVHFALINYEGTKNNKPLRISSFILMVLIAMSTVFIKQHSILDVVYGVLLVSILYILVYKVDYSRIQQVFSKFQFKPFKDFNTTAEE